MKIKKWLAGTGAAALVATALAVIPAVGASAHTPDVTVGCSTLDVNLTNYAQPKPDKDAVYEDVKVIDTPAQDEVSHVITVVDSPEVAAVPAVTHVEYEFKQIITGKTKTNADRWWNPGLGWYFDGNTVTITDSPAKDAIPAVTHEETVIDSPAVAEVSHMEHRLVSGAVPSEKNHVNVKINGHVADDRDFGTSFAGHYAWDKYESVTYEVTVIAWDNPTYNHHESGTTTPCFGTQPETTTTTSAWMDDGKITCNQKSVDTARTVTVTEYIKDETAETGYRAETSSAVEHGSREVKKDEWKDCPAVVTPPTSTPTAAAPSPTTAPTNNVAVQKLAAAPVADTVSTEELAHTGSDYTGIALIAGLLVVAGLIAAAVSGLRGRRRVSTTKE